MANVDVSTAAASVPHPQVTLSPVNIMFGAADVDGSGSISVGEFRHLCFRLGVALTEAEAQLAVRILDQDGNGRLESDEFQVRAL